MKIVSTKSILSIVILTCSILTTYCASMELIGYHSFCKDYYKDRVISKIDISEIDISEILHEKSTYRNIEKKYDEFVIAKRIIECSV